MSIIRKIQYNSPVILTFALVSLAALLLGIATDGRSTTLLFCTYRSSLLDPLTYIRMFGHVLGHANLTHYTNNMLLILLIGPMLEEKYGSKAILSMIVITALLTGIINSIFFTAGLLGASGVAFMMIILASMASAQDGRIPLTLIFAVVVYLGQEVMNGLFTKDNISQLTHLLGGICGGTFGVFETKQRSKDWEE